MPLFLVTYDLLKRKDYPQLWAAFDHLGAHRAAFSTYFVEAAMTAEQLKNYLGDFIDYDDRLVVAEVSKRPALQTLRSRAGGGGSFSFGGGTRRASISVPLT